MIIKQRSAKRRPRFTDAHRYPRGYVPSFATNIRRTFARVRKQLRAASGEKI